MRVAITLLSLVLLAGIGETEGKGLLRSGYTGASRSSSKWKYAAVGVGGGVLLGYGLAYSYHNYRDYRSRFDNEDWYRRNQYYNNWQSRPVGCNPSGGLREYETDGWLIAQISTTLQPHEFLSYKFEVDLFNELMYRIPCSPPTQAAVLNICNSGRAVTDAEMKVTGICATEAVFTSEHTSARRRLLQLASNDTTVIVVAIGLDPNDYRLGQSEAEMALRESLADPNSQLRSQYKLSRIYKTEVSAGAGLTFSAILLFSCVFFLVIL
eukprot:TRINITY_DN8054_c4_g1_i1.p1 TRINITY_DN8054_c4_g1~~TRINITY_DN8054_c4_g1_i1.p1  ORF type:complete len:267 (+),score=40.89 TRINITY_DN8054_c4_g1_i1:95-895(+)